MNRILITPVIPVHDDLKRLHLFPGRHMGEEEFDRLQAYADRRMAPLLTGIRPGIVQGLRVRSGQADEAGDRFTVDPGLAVAGNGQTLGLFYPLRENWSTLIDAYLQETHAADAAGLFYLTLRRTTRFVDDDPQVDPCQREEFDPTRDARRLMVGSLGLKRLTINAAEVTSQPRERLENWAAANHVDGHFLQNMANAVPLGLLAVEPAPVVDSSETPEYRVRWFSESAGRYPALKDSGYQVLQHQVSEAFRRVLLKARTERPEGVSLQEFIEANCRLDFLPATGELPLQLLTDIASPAPSISWLPAHLGVDLVAVPESSVTELLQRHLPRRVVDLRGPAGDRLRLLLALPDGDYRPDLLDVPQPDSRLYRDLFRYYMRAYDVWKDWRQQFDHLYALLDSDALSPAEIKALDLPKAVPAPQSPQDFFRQLIKNAPIGGDNDDEGLPYPYNQPFPGYPDFYRAWGTEVASGEVPEILPPAVPEPEEDGVLIRYSIARVELEALDNTIRTIRARLEKTRDFLLLQRQQLDNQTVSLASLAGGVAGDGSGLQVARWLPFTKLTAESPERDIAGTSTRAPLVMNAAPGFVSGLKESKVEPKEAKAADSSESSGNYIYATPLWGSPSSYSSLQFNYNSLQISKLAAAPKKALTEPAFEPKVYRFGTIAHIRPEIQEYKKTVRGMRELLTTLDGLFDTAEAKSLKKTLNRHGKPKSLEELGVEETTEQTEELVGKLYEALFDAGAILTKQIAAMEGRYARLEAHLEGRLRKRLALEAKIDKLIAQLKKGTRELQILDGRQVDFLGDYGVTQHLLDDDWQQVYRNNLERSRILTTAARGLYFIRERQAPISMLPADPLLLRYGRPDDIVPGCDSREEVELPDPLEDFFDTVLEVPMNDWAVLKPLRTYIPPPGRLEYIAGLRSARLKGKLAANRKKQPSAKGLVKVSLFTVQQQTQSVLMQMARKRLPHNMVAGKADLRRTARVLSLEDIVSNGKGSLFRKGMILHNRLQQAVSCLLGQLQQLSPSLRLQWAQMAEDDRLDVEKPLHWPSLERAEQEDFNTVRSLVELLAWWFGQLDKGASGEARSAMRNMIRACLIHSALGDPKEIIKGMVHVPPRRLAPGESLRLRLNRPPVPGTVLQLLDPLQRPVALLRVEDHDHAGTIAHITRVSKKNSVIDTRFQVVAGQLTRQLLR